MRARTQTLFLTLLVVTAGLVGFHARALAADASLEYRVKAAFLYNFAKFVTWPGQSFSSPSEAMTFCLIGEDPFEEVLDSTIDERRIDGRGIVVRRLPVGSPLAGCHLMFSSESDSGRMARVLQQAGASRSLTVGEGDDFLERGGMIRLFVDEGKVRFDINVKAAEIAGLKFSSQLLKLARNVER